MTRLPTWHSKLEEASTSSFNMQSSNFRNKDGQQLQGEINQITRNFQPNQEKPKSTGLVGNDLNAMRLQQEANLARIKNQVHRYSYNHPSKLSGIYQNTHQASSRNQPQFIKQKGNIFPNQNRQPNLPRQIVKHRQNQPGNNQPQVQNQQLSRFQTQTRNNHIQHSIWKPNLVNSRSQNSTRQVKAIQQTNNTIQPISKSSLNSTQEAMRNRLAQMQQQNKPNATRFPQKQNTTDQSTTNRKLLEDMKQSKLSTTHLPTDHFKIKNKNHLRNIIVHVDSSKTGVCQLKPLVCYHISQQKDSIGLGAKNKLVILTCLIFGVIS